MTRKPLRPDVDPPDLNFLTEQSGDDSLPTGDGELVVEPSDQMPWEGCSSAGTAEPFARLDTPLAEASEPSASVHQHGEIPCVAHTAAVATAVKSATNATTAVDSSDRATRAVAGYAIAVTILLIYCVMTGRLSLSGNASLESLPDVRPLAPNEFRKVPADAKLPDGHALQLGESRRFGDVVITPVRVTREPLTFEAFQSGAAAPQLTTAPVLKLWLTFDNVADDYGFPPFDSALMSHRTPLDAIDEHAVANSFLTVRGSNGEPSRLLNHFQSMDNNFVLTDQNSAAIIMPGESLTTFIASSSDIPADATAPTSFTWRVQFRKGVNRSRGQGVTTLVDVAFTGEQILADSAG